MISSLVVKNFKSFVDAVLPLSSVTYLIGANASGKSNVLESLRLLNWLAKGLELKDIEGRLTKVQSPVRGSAKDLFNDPAKSLTLGCRLAEEGLTWTDLAIEIGPGNGHLIPAGESVSSPDEALPLYRVAGESQEHPGMLDVLYNTCEPAQKLSKTLCLPRQTTFSQLTNPTLLASQDKEARQVLPAVTGKFLEQLRNIVFFDLNPAVMRDYVPGGDKTLEEDGSNLSSVLDTLCAQKQAKQALLDLVRSLPEQDITDISFIRTERNDVMVRLQQSFGKKKQVVEAPLLSDGTLRMLAIGAALLATPEHHLVVLEAVDNGIHPSRVRALVRQLQTIAASRHLQLLVTTHNPALLDAIPHQELESVLCCYRDPVDGDSRILRLTDLERFPELMAQGSLGELVTNNKLDKFLKDTTTDEERKQKTLAWLRNLEQQTGARTSDSHGPEDPGP